MFATKSYYGSTASDRRSLIDDRSARYAVAWAKYSEMQKYAPINAQQVTGK